MGTGIEIQKESEREWFSNEAGNRFDAEKMLLTPIDPNTILWLISL